MAVDQKGRPPDIAHGCRAMLIPERTHDANTGLVEDGAGQAITLSHARPIEQYHIHEATPHGLAIACIMRTTDKGRQMINDSTLGVSSIGYSLHEMPYFLELLKQANVNALADVRTHPASRYRPQFNKTELEAALKGAGIVYVFLGDQLGGRPEPMELYDEQGRVDYVKTRATDFFKRGIERLCKAREKYRVVMLCGEEDPLDCHRGLMISPALVEQGIQPIHLRGDGSAETTSAMEDRLLELTGLGGLFALDEEERPHALAAAYVERARRVAYRLSAKERADDEDAIG